MVAPHKHTPGQHLQTTFSFLTPSPLYVTEKPYVCYFDDPPLPPHIPKSNLLLAQHPITVRDIRGYEHEYTIARHGFGLVQLETRLPREEFDDVQKVKQVYLKEVEESVKGLFDGATRVQAYNHRVRRRHKTFPNASGEKYKDNQPASLAHIDTTPEAVAAKVKELNPDTYEDLLSRRVVGLK